MVRSGAKAKSDGHADIISDGAWPVENDRPRAAAGSGAPMHDPQLLARLRAIVGSRHVLTGRAQTRRYATGYRTGEGAVAAVVRPACLIEQWQVFKACVEAGHIVLAQAANTGLTGGSTPHGNYDRPIIVVNTLRIRGITPILDGTQVICLAGSTLHNLERVLAPLGREPHSVIGSSCIGASVVGGVCNNSGGALVSRGPAYTEYALYGQVDAAGAVSLCNHLGVRLGDTPEAMLGALDSGRFCDSDVVSDGRAASSAEQYGKVVRGVDRPSPARFNADASRLFEAAGSAGKVMVFAVRLETFAKAASTAVFYIGTNDTVELAAIRRRVLTEIPALPVSGEYVHRDAFDVAARYGKDTVLAIRLLGTDRLSSLFRVKDWVDRIGRATRFLPAHLADKLLQAGSRVFPNHLPQRMRDFRDRFEHHLIVKVADDAVEPFRTLLESLFPSSSGDVFECTPREAEDAMLHRFAIAGAAVRYRATHQNEVEDIVALDVALRRNDDDWFERLPPELEAAVIVKLYYGHFFCHVFHQDYLIRKGADPVAVEHQMLELLDRRGAEYPAEHNVGHLYPAKPALADHYRRLDPCNQMNPGIGHTSRNRNWT